MPERVEKALRRSALWDEVKDRLDTSAMGLSGGQQQRLCIARALAVEPEVLLMDEPCSALDPIATTKVEELIYELKRDYTIVIVTHNMQQAARVSESTAFFMLGRLVEHDRTEKIFTNPGQKITEDYITGPVRLDAGRRQERSTMKAMVTQRAKTAPPRRAARRTRAR